MILIYVNPGNSTVMDAQVVSLLNYYNSLNVFNKIILLQGTRNREEKMLIDKKLNSYRNVVYYFKTFPNYVFFDYLNKFFHFKVLNSVLASVSDKYLVHTREDKYGSYVADFFKSKKLKQNLLVDFRGALVEEYKNYYKINSIFKWLKIRNTNRTYLNIIEKNVNVTVVSDSFKKYLINNYNFKCEKITVHPNICNNRFSYNGINRSKIRQKLGLSDEQIVAIMSTGDIQTKQKNTWQKDQTLISKLLEFGIYIINLSRIPVNVKGVINEFVSFNEVPNYLSAADIAVLWRDKNMVNEVASPSKYSEFACSGLYVLHNGSVGIARNFLQEFKFGKIFDSIEEIDSSILIECKNYNRSDASRVGLNFFSDNVIAQSYINTYKNILNEH